MVFEDLINRLAAARAKDLTIVTVEGLNKLFEEMGEKNAESIVSTLEEFDNVPSNLYGVIKKMWREKKARQDNEHLWKDKWVNKDEGTTTPGEWSAYFAILTEVSLWHSMDLIKKNPNGITIPCDILEWKRLGCPKTWSPILDHFFEGFLKTHSQSGMACESFMKTYLMLLQKKRMSDHSDTSQDIHMKTRVGDPVTMGNLV
jgi:hypothetical protein